MPCACAALAVCRAELSGPARPHYRRVRARRPRRRGRAAGGGETARDSRTARRRREPSELDRQSWHAGRGEGTTRRLHDPRDLECVRSQRLALAERGLRSRTRLCANHSGGDAAQRDRGQFGISREDARRVARDGEDREARLRLSGNGHYAAPDRGTHFQGDREARRHSYPVQGRRAGRGSRGGGGAADRLARGHGTHPIHPLRPATRARHLERNASSLAARGAYVCRAGLPRDRGIHLGRVLCALRHSARRRPETQRRDQSRLADARCPRAPGVSHV